jgi:hypothetical protein
LKLGSVWDINFCELWDNVVLKTFLIKINVSTAIYIVSSSGSDTGGCMLDWHL